MYDDVYGDPYAPRKKAGRAPKQFLPVDQQESLLASLARQSGSFVESLGLLLDTPGAIARGVLAGDPLSGFNFDSDRRVSGEELLKSYGIDSYTGNKSIDSYLGVPVGIATEIATDPLFWLTGPLNALTNAGKAAKRAGLLDLARVAAQNKMGTTAARATRTGQRTVKALAKAGVKETAGNLAVRPYVGQRLAQNTATLDDVIKAAPNRVKARADVDFALEKMGLNYSDVANEKLGGLFGFGALDSTGVNVPGTEGFLDLLDSTGDAIKWSAPVRYGSAAFDKRVAGNIDTAGQIAALRRSAKEEGLLNTRRALASAHLQTIHDINLTPQAKQLLGADSLNSREGNDLLLRLAENKATTNDLAILRAAPELGNYRSSWDSIRTVLGDERKALGIKGNVLKQDKWGAEWNPRYGDEFDLGPAKRSPGRGEYSTATGEAMARRQEYMTPGGTVDMRELSELPEIREHARLGTDSGLSEDNVADIVKDYFRSKYGGQMVSNDDAHQIARLMGRMNKDLPDNVPAFAMHPANAQARAIINSAKARANAEFVYESLGEAAEPVLSSSIAGAGYRTAADALNMVAKSTGLKMSKGKPPKGLSKAALAQWKSQQKMAASPRVKRLLQDQIASRYGIADPKTIDLTKYAISEDTVNRLTKIQDFYSRPEVQNEVLKLFDNYTKVFKGMVLAFPSTKVRDSYSNLFSNWVVVGDANNVLRSTAEASKIVAGKIDSVLPDLQQIPRYAGLRTLEDVRREFLRESGGSGILSGLSTTDLLKSTVEGEYAQLVPGATPAKISSGLRTLIPDGSRNVLQQVGDFGAIQGVTNKYATRNPLMNSSNQISDAIDSMHRLGGYIALLKKGYSPEQAAKEIKRALVDYSSLTPLEKTTFKAIFPWWSFQSRTGKFVVEELLNRPGGRFSQTLRTLNTAQKSDEEEYIPTSLRSQFALRIPEELRGYLGLPENSEATTYLTDVDVPGVDLLNIIKTSGGVPSLQGTTMELLSQMNPLLKSAAELATNTDFYTRRPLNQSVTRADRIYQAVTGREDTLNPFLKAAINNAPLPLRAVNTIGGLLDQRVPLQQRLVREGVNAFSGVKLRDVDPEWQLQDARRKIASQLEGHTKDYVESFIPEALLPYVSPQELDLYNLDKELRRDLRQMKDAKRKAGEF